MNRCASPLEKYMFMSNQPLQTGMGGKIYAAIIKCSNIPVVIKVSDLKTKGIKQSFEREVYFLSRLRPLTNVVKMNDCFVFKGLGFIVLEKKYCDLYDRVDKSSFNLEKAKEILFQIVLALNDLHKMGVAHLDIKPENILLDESDNVFLCDFGTAAEVKYFGQKCNNYVGSIFYLPPEVMHPKQGYDPFKADVWSAGILFYVIVTGKYPFSGETVELAQKNFQNSVLSFEDSGDKEFSCINYDNFLSLVKSMLQHDPHKRISFDEIITHPFFL